MAAACLLAGLSTALVVPAPAVADPAADLATAEAALGEADSRLATAEAEVESRREALEPVARRSRRLGEAADRAQAKVDSVEAEVREERLAAARDVAQARADYDDEVATRDGLRTAGIVAMVLAAVLALVGIAWKRVRRWPLGATATRAALGATALAFVTGLALVLVPSDPSPPQFSEEQLALATAAEGEPLDPPTAELRRARAAAAPHIAAARDAAAAEAREQAKVRGAREAVAAAKRAQSQAEQETDEAKRAVARIEGEEAEEAAFREEATTIDYDQLIKDASDFKGEKVVYTGQIFQIQEFAGESIILLSVTDEGYGFWDDNIWVDYAGEIDSAEEDIITVYGKITGSKEYETQIGGSTYVPRMTARYIDE